MSRRRLRIATRKSPLALWQAEHVAAGLRRLHRDLDVELVAMTTRGDRILDTPLARIGGKALFVKELERGIWEGRADVAVHSMKDVPAQLPEGLHLAVVLERENPCDAFVSIQYEDLDSLPLRARLGTASLRRECQLRAQRPDLQVGTLRGNVQTRLARLERGEFDAIVLAAAGLRRLGLEERIRCILTPEQSLPAVGQGALGIECRIDDQATNDLIAPLTHQPSYLRVMAERAVNARLEGSCQVPIAAFALLDEQNIWLRALVGSRDGSCVLRGEIRGLASAGVDLGRQLADDLLSRGAAELLAAVDEE